MRLQPMKMRPIFKEKIWGGTALRDVFKKPIPPGKTGESWEVAIHKHGQSIIANGEFEGLYLSSAIDALGVKLLGDAVVKSYPGRFPLLLKILDCCDRLSIQVHPDDRYAAIHESGELGKTEMWYVLDAKPGAKLIYGFAKDVTRQEFADAVYSGSLEPLLNYVEVKKGDCFFIPAGTLHALLDGLLIAEIQQNSDTTYRVYDYNRTDQNGNKRPLHIKKALDVTNLSSSRGRERIIRNACKIGENTQTHLVSCKYFTVSHYEVARQINLTPSKQSFELLLFCEGGGIIGYDGGSVEFLAGDSFVIPAYLGDYCIEGKCSFLKTHVTFEGEAR